MNDSWEERWLWSKLRATYDCHTCDHFLSLFDICMLRMHDSKRYV